MRQLQSLRVLNLSGTQIPSLPIWLFELERLTKLTIDEEIFETLPENLRTKPAMEIVVNRKVSTAA